MNLQIDYLETLNIKQLDAILLEIAYDNTIAESKIRTKQQISQDNNFLELASKRVNKIKKNKML